MTQASQIVESRKATQALLQHIRADVMKDNKGKVAKMPFRVPQPFDKSPYVSLHTGKKMSVYTHKQTILSTEFDLHRVDGLQAKDSAPIHIFNIKFWPLSNKPSVPDLGTELHDPAKNGFEVAENFRLAVYCDSCEARLKMIHCKTCLQGYCFPCVYRTHGREGVMRSHVMEVVEPRIVQDKAASASLVYHIDLARSVSYDLRYLVKYMRSNAEIVRLKREKQLMKEYEQQEEARRLAHLRAMQESQQRHLAATAISLLFRRQHAKKLVGQRRAQLHFEGALRRHRTFIASIVCVQKTYRMFAIRNWFFKQGFKFKHFHKSRYNRREKINRKGKNVDKAALRQLVVKSVERRLVNKRLQLFQALQEAMVELGEV
jgi:hypothetical protein